MFDLNRFTNPTQNAFMEAQNILRRYEQNQLDSEHLLLAFLEDSKNLTHAILKKLDVAPDKLITPLEVALAKRPRATMNSLENGQVFVTPRFHKMVDAADKERERYEVGFAFTAFHA